jgi:hypothetical protein
MALDLELLHRLTQGTAKEAWWVLIEKILNITSAALPAENVAAEVVRRDLEIGELDHLLSSSAWDLWEEFGRSVEHTSERLLHWWKQPYSAHAVLILDGLSLRELPWLLQGARERGFILGEVTATASELPGTTSAFAQALGLTNRSDLKNNSGGPAHRLQPSRTDSGDMPWAECGALIDATPNWVFWHHWPDNELHEVSGAGQGIDALTPTVAKELTSEAFWSLIERLATGRRLVITSDHGYAATGYFPDAQGELRQFLKETFANGRCVMGKNPADPFIPPVTLWVSDSRPPYILAVGRRKWKNHSGYPTLTHGGLSLLKVLSPFVELAK